MKELCDSIMRVGVLTPATVRKKEDGRYEMISGHRRKFACKKMKIPKLWCEIVQVDRDDAIIKMVDSNLQREEILPCERGFAYKMRMEAMKRKAGRPRENACQVGMNLLYGRTDDILAQNVVDSARQIQRYIRLTFLVEELQEMVNEKRIKMDPAVKLSYLVEEEQRDLVDLIDTYDCTPSGNQAERLKKLSQEGKLTRETMEMILQEEKPNQKDRVILRGEQLKGLLPTNLAGQNREQYIVRALTFYKQYQQKLRKRSQEQGVPERGRQDWDSR